MKLSRQVPKTFAAAVVALSCLAVAGPAGAAGKASKQDSSTSGFIGQMQVTATIMRAMRPAGILQVDAGLFVSDDRLRARAANMGPVLRAAWRGAAQEYVAQSYTAGRVPDAQLLGQRLQAATDRAIGAPGARVYIVSLIAR